MISYDPTFSTLWAFYMSENFMGILYVLGVVLIFSLIFTYARASSLTMLIDIFYEKVFEFYESILGKESSLQTKTFVVVLFFIIFLTNVFGVVLDFIAPVFGISPTGTFYLEEYIRIPSADLQFNIALALISMIILIILQFSSIGGKNFILTYLPINGKGYLTVEKGNMNPKLYFIVFPIIKFFDICISCFLSFLDLIGLFAKVVSLSFRLFGNIVSGGVLLTMLIVALAGFTESFTQFIGGINFPVLIPLVLYAQSLLVAVIQAMVFPLLVAIFIKVSQLEA